MLNQSILVRVLLPVVILSLAAFAAYMLIESKPPVAKKDSEERLRKVTVMPIKLETVSFPVSSQGNVLPAKKIRYLSETNGRILKTSENWQDGAYFRQGEVMLIVEDHVYQSQLAKAKAAEEQAKATLTQEIANAHVAKKTLEASDRKHDNEAARSLALREPQQETAKAQLASARADVEAASIMLEKTYVRAPFDGIVNNKTVDIGQVVGSGQLLADFYGVEKAEIRVPLTLAQQAYLDLPPLAQKADIPVDIIYKTAGFEHHLKGRLVRTSAVLDEATRVLHGIIEIDDPYNLAQADKVVLPLGAFVEVSINSKEQADIVRLPSRLLRPGNRLWVADKDDKLRQRDVQILPSRSNEIYIYQGVQEGDRIVISSIIDAHAGTRLDITLQQDVAEQDVQSE